MEQIQDSPLISFDTLDNLIFDIKGGRNYSPTNNECEEIKKRNIHLKNKTLTISNKEENLFFNYKNIKRRFDYFKEYLYDYKNFRHSRFFSSSKYLRDPHRNIISKQLLSFLLPERIQFSKYDPITHSVHTLINRSEFFDASSKEFKSNKIPYLDMLSNKKFFDDFFLNYVNKNNLPDFAIATFKNSKLFYFFRESIINSLLFGYNYYEENTIEHEDHPDEYWHFYSYTGIFYSSDFICIANNKNPNSEKYTYYLKINPNRTKFHYQLKEDGFVKCQGAGLIRMRRFCYLMGYSLPIVAENKLYFKIILTKENIFNKLPIIKEGCLNSLLEIMKFMSDGENNTIPSLRGYYDNNSCYTINDTEKTDSYLEKFKNGIENLYSYFDEEVGSVSFVRNVQEKINLIIYTYYILLITDYLKIIEEEELNSIILIQGSAFYNIIHRLVKNNYIDISEKIIPSEGVGGDDRNNNDVKFFIKANTRTQELITKMETNFIFVDQLSYLFPYNQIEFSILINYYIQSQVVKNEDISKKEILSIISHILFADDILESDYQDIMNKGNYYYTVIRTNFSICN